MKYLKLHQKYILNKMNLIILGLLIVINILISIISINNLNAKDLFFNIENATNTYLENGLMLFKLIIISILCFVWGTSFTIDNEAYHILVNNYNQNKVKYFLSKIGILCIVSFIVIFLIFITSSLFGIKYTYFYENNSVTLNLYMSYILLIYIYGFLSITFTLIIPSNFASFISVGLFVFGEIAGSNIDNDKILDCYYLLFPTLNLAFDNVSRYGLIHLVLLCVIYFLLCFMNYLFKKN